MSFIESLHSTSKWKFFLWTIRSLAEMLIVVVMDDNDEVDDNDDDDYVNQ